jgi:predicted kinase
MKTSKQRGQTDADRVLLSLGELPPPVARPALVVVAGLPGTGKSQFCRELKLRTAAVILQSDAVRRLLFERPAYSWSESRCVFSALQAATRKLLDTGISCIVDATNVAKVYRQPLYDIAEERGAKLVVVEVTAPEEVVMARLSDPAITSERLSDADVAVYERMQQAWEEIGQDHFVVDTSKPTDDAVDAVAWEMADP